MDSNRQYRVVLKAEDGSATAGTGSFAECQARMARIDSELRELGKTGFDLRVEAMDARQADLQGRA